MSRFQAVNLEKSEKVVLTKVNETEPLEILHLGLGWDIHGGIDADLDAFIIQMDSQGREIDTLYFGSHKYKNKLYSKDTAIIHSGDNLTGEGDGDDEVITIHLNKLNPATKKLIVAVNIYSARLTFNEVENAFVRLLDVKNKDLIATYNLSQEFGENYTMIVGEIIKKDDNTFDFIAIGEATKDKSIFDLRKRITIGSSPHTITIDPSNGRENVDAKKKKGLFGRLFS